MVEFIPFKYEGAICYNLFLGDWNEEINSADELIISNNQDSLKVLVIKNCGYSPAAIRKTEEAIKFLEKAGLPEELLKLRDAQNGKK